MSKVGFSQSSPFPAAARGIRAFAEGRNMIAKAICFPAPKNAPLSTMAMAMLLRRMKAEITMHGFRSSFRDWASETTGFFYEVCEMALAHTITDKAEAAYRRADRFEKR